MKNIFKKKKTLILIVIIAIILIAVLVFLINGLSNKPPKLYVHSEEESSIVSLYTALINDIMEQDTALNHEMKYLALDTDSFIKQNNEKLSNLEIYAIISNINEKYDNIIQASMQDLEDQGLFNEEELYIEGVLISVIEGQENEKNKVTDNKAVLNLMKYKGGLGAVFPTYKCKLVDNIWTIEITSMGIS